jgi:hypothetical protein
MVSLVPTNRIPLIRTRRPSGFSQEVLDLFVALERVAPRRRFADPRTKKLAGLLGLMDQFWSVNFVNDIAGPPIPAGGRRDWVTCRAVREVLLETVAGNVEESAAAAD